MGRITFSLVLDAYNRVADREYDAFKKRVEDWWVSAHANVFVASC